MDTRRLMTGFGWGVVATIVMSLLMLLGLITGISPMPKPIPVAIMGKLLGPGTPMPLILLLAILAHLLYGGIWGAILTGVTRPVTLWKGLGLGIVLWLIMQIVVLPLLGWGFFGSAITPKIAIATLVLHLVYGAMLGWLADRREHAVQVQAEPELRRSVDRCILDGERVILCYTLPI